MTLVLTVLVGIALALLVACVLAAVVSAIFGAAMAAVYVPYAAIRTALRKGRAAASVEASASSMRAQQLASEAPSTVTAPVDPRRSVWLRPAALLFWLGVAVLLDLDGSKSRR